MDLSHSWRYIEYVARTRLQNNKTRRHVSAYGKEIEVIGAAGEFAARRFFGLGEDLHVKFDQGVDIRLPKRTIDVKATRLTPLLRHRNLQWPLTKPIIADIILLTAISIRYRTATIVGYATSMELSKLISELASSVFGLTS